MTIKVMKKLIILLLLLTLFGCTKKEEKPAEPTAQTQPVEEPAPVVVSEKVYVLDDFVVYDFKFEDDVQIYQLKNGIELRFEGSKGSYDTVSANGKNISLYQGIVNSKGKMYMYNLNNELYLIAYDEKGQYKEYQCVVINGAGDVVQQFENVGVTMNTEDQSQFLVTYYKADGSEDYTLLCKANGKILETSKF